MFLQPLEGLLKLYLCIRDQHSEIEEGARRRQTGQCTSTFPCFLLPPYWVSS